MIHREEVTGMFTKLRHVRREDAALLLSYRLDPRLGRFLNRTDPSLERQQEWIESQQQLEGDYYFIITSITDEPVGTIALYRIDSKRGEGEFGRWICPKPVNALESVVLLYDFGFNKLGLRRVCTRTASEIHSVVSFHKRLGARFVRDDLIDPVGGAPQTQHEIIASDYPSIRQRAVALLVRLSAASR